MESPIDTPVRTGGRSGSPTSSRRPPNASATAANPGRSESGPVWPKAEMRVITSSGLTLSSSSGPSPHFSSVPGRKFSSNTSQCRTRSSTISRPRSVLRSITMDFLLRLIVRYSIDVSPEYSRQLRSSSPVTGRSTLMTSAPKSASIRPAVGAAMKLPSSSTRTPASGRMSLVFNVVPCCVSEQGAQRQDEQDRHDRGDGYADRDSLECTARGLSQQRLQQPERIAGDMDTEERARTGGQGDQDRVESDDRRHGREDARRRDRGDGHGTDRDVQSRGDEPHHEQRGGRAGGEVLAKDVAETGRLDGGGQRAAHAGEDQD